MCGSSPSAPKPIPPPIHAEFAKRRAALKRPKPGTTGQTLLTGALGLSSKAVVQKPTLLGQ